MTNRPTLRNSLGFILIALALSACGGGGGSSSGSNNNFVTANSSSTTEVTKPEATSSEASSSSSTQSTTSSAISSTQSLSSSSQASQTSSSSSSRTIYSNDAIAPSAPDTFTAPSKLIHSVTLSWSASSDNVAVIYYRIYRNQVLINTVWAPDNQYIDFNVQADTTYTYGISAGDSSSNWSPIKSITITTPSATASSSSTASSAASSSVTSSNVSSASSSQSSSINDTTAPSKPANLSLIGAYSDHVSISWSPSTDDVAVTNYKLLRDATPIATLTSAQLSYTDTGTSTSQQYTYSISAGDAAGNWSASQSLTVITPSATPNGTVKLYWSAPTQRENGTAIAISELGGYELHYKPTGATRFTTIMLSSADTSYSIANLSSDYEFEIAVYDNNQLYSQFIPLTPQ